MEKSTAGKSQNSVDRIAERHVFEYRFQIRTHLRSENIVTAGWARDMSESGLGGFVAEELFHGEFVTLEIPLNGEADTGIPAKVARCLGTQYGFQFTALSAEQRSKLLLALRGHPKIP